jgi:hypothetical protein
LSYYKQEKQQWLRLQRSKPSDGSGRQRCAAAATTAAGAGVLLTL